jgi:hypothetical protein
MDTRAEAAATGEHTTVFYETDDYIIAVCECRACKSVPDSQFKLAEYADSTMDHVSGND